jgi:dienelactone hydrolase
MELIMLGISVLAVGTSFWIGNKKRKIFLVLLLPMLTAHILIQGMRWQMTFVYFYILFELLGFVRSLGKRKKKKERQISRILWILAFVITGVFIYIFSYQKMDPLNGKYEVGTFAMDLVDAERIELYGDTVGEDRKIRVQLWYPTDDTEGFDKAKWLYDGVEVAKGLPAFVGFPGFVLSYTARFDSNSYKYAMLSEKQDSYPLVVISHGWTGFRNLHTDIAELLASNGYIVASVDHTYGSLATVFNDGTVAKLDLNALPNENTVDNFEEYSNNLVSTYGSDVEVTIDILEMLNEGRSSLEEYVKESDIENLEESEIFETMFRNRINCERIGVAGHSTGGGGVVKLAMTDERIDAVFGFDPWVEPIEESLLEKGLSTPSFFLSSEQWEGGSNSDALKIIADQESTVTQMYQLNGTNHQDFSMMYMFEPMIKMIGFSGELDSLRSREIQQDYFLEFFNYYLLEEKKGWDELANKYEEIIPTDLTYHLY